METRIYNLYRFSHSEDYTYGLLFLESSKYPEGFVLEDEHRDVKVMGETRIPAGTYEIVLNKALTPLTKKYRGKYSWFHWHLMLKEVPGFTGVYIHVGNSDEHTEGCLLMADTCDLTPNTIDGFIGESTPCFERFYKNITPFLDEGNRVFIEIKNLI
jgi:hypothetical protein